MNHKRSDSFPLFFFGSLFFGLILGAGLICLLYRCSEAIATSQCFCEFTKAKFLPSLACQSPCLGNRFCAILSENPPWFIITSVAAAPPLIVTWWYRHKYKVAEIAKGQHDVDIAHAQMITTRFQERISKDTESDHWTVVETLSAFLRQNAGHAGTNKNSAFISFYQAIEGAGKVEEDVVKKIQELIKEDKIPRPSEPIQAVMSFLARRQWTQQETEPVNLSRTTLTRVNIERPLDKRAILKGAKMKGCFLVLANLRNADLSDVDLRGSMLVSADLRGTNLKGALWQGDEVVDEGQGVLIFRGNARFDDAIYDGNTIFPEHFDPKKLGMIESPVAA
jgi:pentapeptide repeat protein